MDKVVQARFAPWTKEGVIFGVPHDVHPVAIAYREDLFREAGVDLAAAKTWPQFRDAVPRFRELLGATARAQPPRDGAVEHVGRAPDPDPPPAAPEPDRQQREHRADEGQVRRDGGASTPSWSRGPTKIAAQVVRRRPAGSPAT